MCIYINAVCKVTVDFDFIFVRCNVSINSLFFTEIISYTSCWKFAGCTMPNQYPAYLQKKPLI